MEDERADGGVWMPEVWPRMGHSFNVHVLKTKQKPKQLENVPPQYYLSSSLESIFTVTVDAWADSSLISHGCALCQGQKQQPCQAPILTGSD